MGKIEILDDYPIILTKDASFLDEVPKTVFEPGAIVLLPEDAILVMPQKTISVEVTHEVSK